MRPPLLAKAQMKDIKRFCTYHESPGHYTHECRQLKEEIESLIRDGKLEEWVVREVRKYKDDKKTEKDNEPKDTKEEEKIAFIREDSIYSIFGDSYWG